MVATGNVNSNDDEKNPILLAPAREDIVKGQNEAALAAGNSREPLRAEASPTGPAGGVAMTSEDPRPPRRGFEACMMTMGLCRCLVRECLGRPSSCRICEPRKVARYKKLEEEYYRAEFGEAVEENFRDVMVINFFMESPEVREFYPLLVTKTMTALNVIRGISVHVNTRDFYRYTIIEFWREFEAERALDDHELVLPLRHDHVRTKRPFIFVYQRDFDKYDYIRDKELFFIHPDTARRKNANKKQSGDPPFIQVWDPFFSMPSNPLAHLPPAGSSQDTTPEMSPETPALEIATVHVETDGNVVQFSKSLEDHQDSQEHDQLIPETPLNARKALKKPSPVIQVLPDQSATTIIQEGPDELERYQQDDTGDDSMVNPIFCGTVYVKQGDRDLTLAEVRKLPNQKEMARWSKKYLLLRNRKLYYVDDHDNMLKCYYMDDEQFREALEKKGKTRKERSILQQIGPMSDYEVYTSIKARRHHNAPHGGSIYLRKHEGSLRKPIKLMFCPKPKLLQKNEEGAPDLSSKGRKLWVTAMRLAKHGAKLKQGYKTYMANLKEYQLKLKVLKDPRVPMDFTQGIGRIVHDAAEIEQIKREPKQAYKPDRFEKYESFPKEALEHGRHLTQKYYHGELTRPEAEKLLLETFTNGAWLLRDSHARTNCLTISYLYEGRVHHKYVSAASYHDESTRQRIYVATLDQQLAFYDVHSLTEFYRLNKGETMLCMLTTSVKKESQRDSSPPRTASDQSPSSSRPVPINLIASSSRESFVSNRSPQSTDSKSPRSLKDFFSKSIQKSKQALKPKKLVMSHHDTAQPSTSKQEEPLESPPSQGPSSSGISSTGTPDSPPSHEEPPQPPV